MKFRSPILAVTALSLMTLGTSVTAAQAAPVPTARPADASAPVAGAPSGKALIRVDGGTAYAKKTGKRAYRLLLPMGADITWMGEVNGKGLRAGTFGHAGLVKGWTRLGHRPGVGVTSTVTWGDKAALVRVSDPRVNANGLLVFTARTGMVLPEKLARFSLNITRAASTPRYPVYFDAVALSNDMQVEASAGGDFSASVAFQQQGSSGNWSNCVSSSNSGEHPISPNPFAFSGQKPKVFYFGPTTCGDVSFLANTTASDGTVLTTEMQYKFPVINGATNTQIYAWFVMAPGSFYWSGILGQWVMGQDGAVACPVNGSTC